MHTEVAGIESRGEIDPRDPGTARPQLLAILPLLEQVSRNPAQVTRADRSAPAATDCGCSLTDARSADQKPPKIS
jgi:hypothetical protein